MTDKQLEALVNVTRIAEGEVGEDWSVRLCKDWVALGVSDRGTVDGAEYERLYLENRKLKHERSVLREALVAMVDDDDPDTLKKMLDAVENLAALVSGREMPAPPIKAIKALLEVRP